MTPRVILLCSVTLLVIAGVVEVVEQTRPAPTYAPPEVVASPAPVPLAPRFVGVLTGGARDIPNHEAGRVLSVLVRPGDVVEANAPLIQLDDQDIRLAQKAALAEVDAADADVRLRQARLAEARDLYNQAVALKAHTPAARRRSAARAVQAARSALSLAKSTLAQRKAAAELFALRLEQRVVRTDRAGTVMAVLVSEGAHIDQGTLVVRMAYEAAHTVKVAVPGDQVGTLTVGQSLRLTQGDVLARAVIENVPPGVDPSTGHQVVEAKVTGPQAGLVPGVPLQVEAETPVEVTSTTAVRCCDAEGGVPFGG